MLVLGIDVGTSAVKVTVLDVAKSTPVGPIIRVTYPLDSPTAAAVEFPAQRIWDAIVSATRQAISKEETRSRIAGVGISCLTPALVLLDEKDEPLLPVWTHLDRRSRPSALQVWQEVGPEFHATCGNRPLPGGMSAICFRQIISDTPALRDRVRSYLHLNGWLGLQLTGNRAFDPANASFTGLYETLGNHQWSTRWCDYFNVDKNWLPKVISGETTLGKLRPVAANALQLPQGIPVKLGTADTSSALLDVGLKPGELLHGVGTTQVLAAIPAKPAQGEHRLVRQLGVGDPGSYLHVSHNPVGGAALEWLRELCFSDVKDPKTFYGELLSEAKDHSTAVVLEPPFLGGDRLEITPQTAGLGNLNLSTDRMDLLSAMIQAMRRGHAEAMANLGIDGEPTRICLTGGGANAVKSLIYGADSRVQITEEGSLKGVARLFASGKS